MPERVPITKGELWDIVEKVGRLTGTLTKASQRPWDVPEDLERLLGRLRGNQRPCDCGHGGP